LISTKALKNKFISSSSRESSSSLEELYLGEFPIYTFFALLYHEACVANLGKEGGLVEGKGGYTFIVKVGGDCI
jgi:hypothetical protein